MIETKEQFSPESKGFRYLLFFLIFYLLSSPFLNEFQFLAIVAHMSMSVVLFFSVWAVQKHQNQRVIAITVMIPLLALYWLGIYDIIEFSRLGSYVLFVLYFGLLAYSYGIQLSRFKRITVNVLSAALCLYLIIALFWGALFSVMYELHPQSFSGSLLENSNNNLLYVFNYFSLVTLTTLGYGDITPQTQWAAAMCMVEAVIGQFFTAVVVGWFVGNIVAERTNSSSG